MPCRNARRHALLRQKGAIMITAALVTMLLLGFIGIALDFGRLFVIKSELQTAMDSCALAAVQELDGQVGAVQRARSAGQTAGNQNRVDFQSANWGGLGQIEADTTIMFRDANFVSTESDGAARYAECQHVHDGATTWLLQALGAFAGDAARFPATRDVQARAVARRGPAQSTCPLPLAVRPKTTNCHNGNCGAPNYGYAPGEWITLVTTSDTGQGGYIGWANLDGSRDANETVQEMNGHCGVTVGQELGTPGVQSTIVDNWNWRFGIYRNNNHPWERYKQPDLTGYSYTAANWPGRSNALQDFFQKRQAFANCIETTAVSNRSLGQCETLLGLRLNSFSDMLAGGAAATGGHRQYGGNRRIALVPVTLSYPGSVADYACMLMLQPLSQPMVDVQLEYIGNASDPGSPCAASGLPGGSAGPLVPTLVR